MKSKPTMKIAIDLLTFNYTIMKKVLLLAVAVAMLTGCSKDVTEIEAGAKRVAFDVQGNWNSPVFTRGSLSADGKEMTDLWLFDYVGGELVQTLHQVSADADFGTPAPTLSYGEHRIYFVVSRGASPVINGTVISWGSIRDTFWKSMAVSVIVNAPEVENNDPENSVARFAINGAEATFTIPIISLSSSRADTVIGVVHSAMVENPKKLTASPVVPMYEVGTDTLISSLSLMSAGCPVR